MLTRDQLTALAPPPRRPEQRAIYDGYIEALLTTGPRLFEEHGITTKLRLCHLLAQWGHECGGFTIQWENMNYSAQRLKEIFGFDDVKQRWVHSARLTDHECERLAHKPEAIAERVYGLGNPSKARELGNTQPGDGYRFRGCGIQQITGRGDHERYADLIWCKVEELCKPENAIKAALHEWTHKGCNTPADHDDIEAVTRKINGGQNGIDDRRRLLKIAKRVIPDDFGVVPTEPEDNRRDTAPPAPLAEREQPAPTRRLFKTHIKECQERLAALNYHLGAADGVAGTLTRSAVLTFQDTNGLPLTGDLDDATVEVLLSEDAKPLPISDQRKSMTADELAARGSKPVALAQRLKRRAKQTATAAGALLLDQASGTGVVDQGIKAVEKVSSLSDRLGGQLFTAKFGVIVLLAGLAGLVWVWASSTESAHVDDARKARNIGN